MEIELRECPFCGKKTLGWDNHEKNCYFTIMYESAVKGVNHSVEEITNHWNTRHEPKNETVEQWEARTGETYPNDGPVWVWDNKYGWMLKQFKRVVLRRPFVRSLGAYMPMLDKKKAIVANHLGKPK